MVEGEGLFPGTFVEDVVPGEGPVENLPLGKDSAFVQDLLDLDSAEARGAPTREGEALQVFSLGGGPGPCPPLLFLLIPLLPLVRRGGRRAVVHISITGGGITGARKLFGLTDDYFHR